MSSVSGRHGNEETNKVSEYYLTAYLIIHTPVLFDTLSALWLVAMTTGEVINGMEIVKAIEAMGSRSGAPKCRITIADSGQIS